MVELLYDMYKYESGGVQRLCVVCSLRAPHQPAHGVAFWQGIIAGLAQSPDLLLVRGSVAAEGRVGLGTVKRYVVGQSAPHTGLLQADACCQCSCSQTCVIVMQGI
jgi:hypothetical protein